VTAATEAAAGTVVVLNKVPDRMAAIVDAEVDSGVTAVVAAVAVPGKALLILTLIFAQFQNSLTTAAKAASETASETASVTASETAPLSVIAAAGLGAKDNSTVSAVVAVSVVVGKVFLILSLFFELFQNSLPTAPKVIAETAKLASYSSCWYEF
jgi:hypothetical protein